ncbi:MAG TPA: putative sulfate exporter family transporter [Ktedonobacteraceae bacterium]|nr:putative sulfate exporter family transporter [Ktedonobacteraceae bacterium]
MAVPEHDVIQREIIEEGDSTHTQQPEARPSFARRWLPFGIGLGLTGILGVIATLLAPLPGLAVMGSLTVALHSRKRSMNGEQRNFNWKKLPLPWFVFGFLIVGAANSLGLFPKSFANLILQVSVFLLVMAMAAMGLMVDIAVIRKTGLKALGVALLGFALFVLLSFVLTSVMGYI